MPTTEQQLAAARAMLAALEVAERAYQVGIFNDREDLWDRAVTMRREAIAAAKAAGL
jgi:hypothetical protein